jgi:ElaB/YqjD/DUF883 family membrane-anchored ribosome-binding protein
MKQFDAGQFADDLQTLVQHAEELLRATANTAGEAATDARERAQESLEALRPRLAAFERDMKGRAKAVDSYVQDNPWTAVAVVGGIALLLGLIMGRGRD